MKVIYLGAVVVIAPPTCSPLPCHDSTPMPISRILTKIAMVPIINARVNGIIRMLVPSDRMS